MEHIQPGRCRRARLKSAVCSLQEVPLQRTPLLLAHQQVDRTVNHNERLPAHRESVLPGFFPACMERKKEHVLREAQCASVLSTIRGPLVHIQEPKGWRAGNLSVQPSSSKVTAAPLLCPGAHKQLPVFLWAVSWLSQNAHVFWEYYHGDTHKLFYQSPGHLLA